MELPTLPFGGLIGIGMIIGSFIDKKHKDILLYGGVGLWGYHFIAGMNNLPIVNPELDAKLKEIMQSKYAYSYKSSQGDYIAPNNMRIANVTRRSVR